MVKDSEEAKLPKQQLTILAICRFAEPVAATSVNPYLPEMIQSFGIPIDKVAKYTGWSSACFSIAQCLTAIAWGRASDLLGRKPLILIALSCTLISSVAFGFSSSIAMLLATRSLQGLSSGNVGIIRTAVAEMVPQKELQPRAFSIMPLVWNVGSVFGPALGGVLVQPAERYPSIFGRFTLLKEYPFALPNLLISVLFLVGISSGFLFLRESHVDLKSRRDYGLILGKLLTRPCTKRSRDRTKKDDEEVEPFLNGTHSRTTSVSKPTSPKVKAAWRDVFSPQSNINLIAYTGLAMHSIAFDQILPVFLHYPINKDLSSPVQPPLKFAGGFGLGSPRIGFIFSIYGVVGMIVQFLVFPPVARKFGVLKCFRACSFAFPFIYLAVPFTSLISTNQGRQGMLLALLLCKCVAVIFAFPCSTILLTNSATSLQVLGTLNGVATSFSALGRAAGPALAGAAFTAGVDAGYIIVPFWVLSAVAVIAALPILWLIEMDGFNAPSDDSDDEEALLDVDSEDDSAIPALSVNVTGTEQADVLAEESRLSPTTSRTSRLSQSRARRTSYSLKKVSSPIGTGPGISPAGARRYSSELGVSMSGYGSSG